MSIKDLTDRELDALVAEKVWDLERHAIPKNSMPDAMGRPNSWPREDSFVLSDGSHVAYFFGHGNDSYRPGDGRELWPGHLPAYSTSIEAAWAVEEKVVEDYGEEYGDALDAIVRDDLEADIGDHYSDAVLTYRLAHATPRQRCLAALAAVANGEGKRG